MTRQNIGIGSAGNDGTGDTLRGAGDKINDNFIELYIKLGGDSDALSDQLSMSVGSVVFEGSATDDHETFLQVVNPTADRIVYIPNAGGTLILDSDTQTMTNKTLTSPVITTPQINDTSSDHQYVVAVSELAADRNVTLPVLVSNDTFVFEAHTATLTNKTLTAATINSPKIVTEILDTNGAELLKVTATASAVNELTLANAASAGKPTISATGGDTNITTKLAAKGSGSIEVTKHAVTATTMTANGAASNATGLIICNKGSALAVSLADGTVVGETKIFTNKGAGAATVTPANFAQGTTFALAQYDAVTVIWDGTNWYLTGNQSTVTVA
tara:strand:+ start:740 stop:1729 length:990 start_codon:yes stop_codon:yes gene_type:complete